MADDEIPELQGESDQSGTQSEVDQETPEVDCKEQAGGDPTQCSSREQHSSDRHSDKDSLGVGCESNSPVISNLTGDTDTQLHLTDADGNTETTLPEDSKHVIDIQVFPADVHQDNNRQVHPPADTEHVTKTREGRVSKMVNRLIESMVQKPFDFRCLANSEGLSHSLHSFKGPNMASIFSCMCNLVLLYVKNSTITKVLYAVYFTYCENGREFLWCKRHHISLRETKA